MLGGGRVERLAFGPVFPLVLSGQSTSMALDGRHRGPGVSLGRRERARSMDGPGGRPAKGAHATLILAKGNCSVGQMPSVCLVHPQGGRSGLGVWKSPRSVGGGPGRDGLRTGSVDFGHVAGGREFHQVRQNGWTEIKKRPTLYGKGSGARTTYIVNRVPPGGFPESKGLRGSNGAKCGRRVCVEANRA